MCTQGLPFISTNFPHVNTEQRLPPLIYFTDLNLNTLTLYGCQRLESVDKLRHTQMEEVRFTLSKYRIRGSSEKLPRQQNLLSLSRKLKLLRITLNFSDTFNNLQHMSPGLNGTGALYVFTWWVVMLCYEHATTELATLSIDIFLD